MCEGEKTKLFEGCFIRDMAKPFHEFQSKLLHLFQCLCVGAKDGMGCLNSIFQVWSDKGFIQVEKILGVGAAKDRFK